MWKVTIVDQATGERTRMNLPYGSAYSAMLDHLRHNVIAEVEQEFDADWLVVREYDGKVVAMYRHVTVEEIESQEASIVPTAS